VTVRSETDRDDLLVDLVDAKVVLKEDD